MSFDKLFVKKTDSLDNEKKSSVKDDIAKIVDKKSSGKGKDKAKFDFAAKVSDKNKDEEKNESLQLPRLPSFEDFCKTVKK